MRLGIVSLLKVLHIVVDVLVVFDHFLLDKLVIRGASLHVQSAVPGISYILHFESGFLLF